MNNGYVDIDVNKDGSVIDGLTLRSLELGGADNVSPCFLEQLNKYVPANVQSSITGGNFGYGNGGVDYGTGIGFVPRSSGGGGTPETCTWRFYSAQGEQAFTMQGPCP